MPIVKPMKTQEKFLSSAPGFIVAGKMTTDDDFHPLFSDQFRFKPTGWSENGGRK